MRYDFRVAGPGRAHRRRHSRQRDPDGPMLNAVLTGERRDAHRPQSAARRSLPIPAITLEGDRGDPLGGAAPVAEGTSLAPTARAARRAATIVTANARTIGLSRMSVQHRAAVTRSIAPERRPLSRSIAEALLRRIVARAGARPACHRDAGRRPAGVRRRRPGPQARLTIHRWRCLWRLATGWDIGFAEAYMAGDWSSPESCRAAAVSPAINEAVADSSMRLIAVADPGLKLRHALNRNTRRGSRRNIAAHYDLGNEFYEQWLDAGMSYSSGLYSPSDQTLEEAQDAKLDRVLDLLEMSGGEQVLEIGCGWGGLAERLLERRDCSRDGAHAFGRAIGLRAAAAWRCGVCSRACDLRLAGLSRRARHLRSHRVDRNAGGGRRGLLADLFRDAARRLRPGGVGRAAGHHHRRSPVRMSTAAGPTSFRSTFSRAACCRPRRSSSVKRERRGCELVSERILSAKATRGRSKCGSAASSESWPRIEALGFRRAVQENLGILPRVLSGRFRDRRVERRPLQAGPPG